MTAVSKHVARDLRQRADVALRNEEVTRERVRGLEAASGALLGVLTRPIWGRFKWLLLGR